MGNIHWAAQRHSQASAEYQAGLRGDPTACPLDLYLKLGTSFLTDGEFEYARNVYVQVKQFELEVSTVSSTVSFMFIATCVMCSLAACLIPSSCLSKACNIMCML